MVIQPGFSINSLMTFRAARCLFQWSMLIKLNFAAGAALSLLLCGLLGCGSDQNAPGLSVQIQQELEKLRTENQEVKKLRVQNQELPRLRKDNQDLQRLRGFEAEIARLRQENEQLRTRLAAIPGAAVPAPATAAAPVEEPPPLQPIQNLPQAFEEAALLVATQETVREEDVPQKGDNILIDQSVIGLLISGFDKNTNGGPYEVSGWLTSKGVVLKNYQQLNVLGITNYNIRRAPPSSPDDKPK